MISLLKIIFQGFLLLSSVMLLIWGLGVLVTDFTEIFIGIGIISISLFLGVVLESII